MTNNTEQEQEQKQKQKQIEHCTFDDIVTLTCDDAESFDDFVAALNTYLHIFAKPIKRGDDKNTPLLCLKCDRQLTGLFGTFTWGIAYGEGICGECRWPGRAIHYPQYKDENMFEGPLTLVLQYHPDNVKKKKEYVEAHNDDDETHDDEPT